jgi:hypothetical protein
MQAAHRMEGLNAFRPTSDKNEKIQFIIILKQLTLALKTDIEEVVNVFIKTFLASLELYNSRVCGNVIGFHTPWNEELEEVNGGRKEDVPVQQLEDVQLNAEIGEETEIKIF